MIKILHVITDSNIGGAGYHLLTLLDYRDKQSFQITVALPVNSRLIPALQKRGIVYHETPGIAERSFSFAGVRSLYQLLKKVKPDIVHTHAALSGRVAARFCGCRIIHTRHTVSKPPAWATRGAGRLLSGWVNNHFSDVIIAVSPAAVQNLTAAGTNAKKIKLVYNGVSPVTKLSEDEQAAVRARYGIKPEAFVVTLLARLSETKGHDYLLDAAVAINDPDVLVLLAGDGVRQAHLAGRLAAEGIQNVRMLGFVEDTVSLLNITNGLVNASFNDEEATSLALAEAMSLGIPAVATDAGGNPYVVTQEQNGLLVPQRDATAIKEAILRLKSDTALYQRLSEGAAQRYDRQFTAEGMTAAVEAIYHEQRGKGNA